MNTKSPIIIELAAASNQQARLRLAREARGLKAKFVAQTIGISPSSLSKWENEDLPEDEACPSVKYLRKLCALYRVNLEWIVLGTLPIEPVDHTLPSFDPLQQALDTRLNKMAGKTPSRQGQNTLANMQSLALSNFLQEGMSDLERELLALYIKTAELSHLPGFKFMIAAIRAAFKSFLASNATPSNSDVTTDARQGNDQP